MINITITNHHKLNSATIRIESTCLRPVITTRYMFLPYRAFIRLYINLKSKGLPRPAEVAQGVPARFLTFRHYKGGSSSAKRTGRLYPRRNPWYSLAEAGSTSGHMVLSGVPRKKSQVTPLGIDPGTVRLAAQCLQHYTNPGPKALCKYWAETCTVIIFSQQILR